jgi:hypothetical protein
MSIQSTTPYPLLTAEERQRLTLWKHRYALESEGFSRQQAKRLLFWRWLVATRRVEA